MVFNATFNTISVLLWQSVFLAEETGVFGGRNHWPAVKKPKTMMNDLIYSTNVSLYINECFFYTYQIYNIILPRWFTSIGWKIGTIDFYTIIQIYSNSVWRRRVKSERIKIYRKTNLIASHNAMCNRIKSNYKILRLKINNLLSPIQIVIVLLFFSIFFWKLIKI